MLRLCNQCKCELNGINTAKKDAKRFRKICRSCFRKKRNNYRLMKTQNQVECLHTLIEQNIVKIDFDPLVADQIVPEEIIEKKEENFLVRMVNMLKNIIKER